jgi:hypothetical protein
MEQVVAVGARREAWTRQRGHGIVLDTKWVDGTVGLMLRHAVGENGGGEQECPCWSSQKKVMCTVELHLPFLDSVFQNSDSLCMAAPAVQPPKIAS